MDKIRKKMNQFMMGRYGPDALNSIMLYTAVILNLLGILLKNAILGWISLVLLVYSLYCFFSKNLAKRYAENQKFLDFTRGPRRLFKAAALSARDKEHTYVTCPKCKQICRLPKGRGKVTVTCPACRQPFEGRS